MNFSMFDNTMFESQYHNSSVKNSEQCDFHKNSMSAEKFPAHTPLAMAYVPMQQWGSVYSEEKALTAGTIFPELDLPFDPEGGCYEQR